MDERAKETSLALINKGITGIARSAVKLNDTIHNVGVLMMEHVRNFGDTTAVGRLVDAMPKTHRRNLLIDWFDAFSPIGIAKDAKSDKMKGFLRGKTDERDALWNIEGAKATPFFALPQAEREPEVPTFETLHSNVVAFIKRIEKRAEMIVDPADRAKAEAEVGKLKASVAA